MERMVIKHLSGSKANQVEEFALRHHNELIFGRDTSATVKYDPDRDDLVGRQHAKITKDPSDPNGFLLTDLNSTNGTFHNKQRITGAVKLNPGDSVQFGPGGPEFVFEVEPRPANYAKATRMVDANKPTMPQTRMVETGAGAMSATAGAGGGKAPGTVGKATVERMISQTVTETKKSQTKKFGIIGAAAAFAVLILFGVVIGGAYWYSTRESARNEEMSGKAAEKAAALEGKTADLEKKITEGKSLSAADINDKFGKSVVYFEAAWRLINTAEQAQAFHAHFSPAEVKALFKADVGAPIPLYVQVDTDTIEPVLRYSKGPSDRPIGGVHSGTGFIVTTDGFVLTNRHVAAAWMSVYDFPADTPPGIVLSGDYRNVVATGQQPPGDWVPANSQQAGGMLGGRTKVASPAELKGVNDTLDVTLPGKESRMAASLKQISDRHDVALVKIDVPGQLTKAELYDNYDTLKKGEQVVVLGYPAASPRTYGIIKSSDTFNSATRLKVIPDPTVTLTNVGNIIRDSDKDDKKRVSTMGDVIQLATSETGSGNSGGPVFDMQGRVIGIFFASSRGTVSLTYAVPIRYGKEFLAGE
jgi:S1-C subfamily serine protease/pSer/pThr/pTyr-binding forkhead associated (FHA) protein